MQPPPAGFDGESVMAVGETFWKVLMLKVEELQHRHSATARNSVFFGFLLLAFRFVICDL